MRKNRLVYYFLWILSLVGISFYGGIVSYGIFAALTLVPVIMYAYLVFVLITFTLYQELGSKTPVCRTPVSYYFTLQNETEFAFARLKVVFYEFGVDYGALQADDEYELMPKEGRRVSTNIVCKYRGEYEIGVKKVIITDFLGLFHLTYKNREPLKVDVLPAIEYPSENLEIDRPLFANRSGKNMPEVRDIPVRPYGEGDSLRGINWKATAKNLKLMTATMSSEERSSLHILLDTCRYGKEIFEYIPREDELLTHLISLVIYYVSRNISVVVSYYSQGMKHVSIRSMQQFEEFYTSISAVRFTYDTDVYGIYEDLKKSGTAGEEILLLQSSKTEAAK